MSQFKRTKCFSVYAVLFSLVLSVGVFDGPGIFAEDTQRLSPAPLHRAKIYLAAGDYRRAVEACQLNIDQNPSVESYVYLIYVYHAIGGYQEWLAQQDKWSDVGRLGVSMVDRGTLELVDPPNTLSRMSKEILDEGLRVQFDIVAGMANRLDKSRVDQLWLERKTWEQENPKTWWSGVPVSWNW